MKNSKKETSVRLMLNKCRILKNGTYPLVFQLIHGRRKRLIYTGYHLKDNEFDNISQTVQYCEDSLSLKTKATEMNKLLGKERRRIHRLIRDKENDFFFFSVDSLIKTPPRKSSRSFLLQYWDQQIERKKVLGKDGTAAAYQSTRISFEKYLHHIHAQVTVEKSGKQTDIHLSSIDRSLVRDYEDYLYHKGLAENTVSYYLRNFRTIFNIAVTSGECMPPALPPFVNIRTRPSQTVKRALSRHDMKKMAMLNLAKNTELVFSRDLYLFSFFAQGMAFVDIAYLKKKNICNGVLTYARHKSKQLIQILITPEMQEMIDKYPSDNEYIFPIFNTSLDSSIYLQYRSALGKINRHLKTLGHMLKMDMPITTYTARHTWATLARDTGAPVSAISAGLGHTSEEMTRVYLKEFDVNILARVNSDVTNLLKR